MSECEHPDGFEDKYECCACCPICEEQECNVLRAEVKRLQAALDAAALIHNQRGIEMEKMKTVCPCKPSTPDSGARECDRLRTKNKLLRELLHEVAVSGLQHDKSFDDMVVAQIDRVTWNQIQETAK